MGGLGDVVTSLAKAHQATGTLVEIVMPKYDCANYGCADCCGGGGERLQLPCFCLALHPQIPSWNLSVSVAVRRQKRCLQRVTVRQLLTSKALLVLIVFRVDIDGQGQALLGRPRVLFQQSMCWGGA